MRILAKALPNQQWEVERRIRKLIKDEFDRENIDFIEKNRLILDESLKGGNSHG
jgi:small conductance mechanosensitive channel